MKLATMQSCIGYFQLTNMVDKFIFYDDVTFLKQDWINRNRTLINSEANTFSVTLYNASSHTMIKNVIIYNEFMETNDYWNN